MKNIFLKKKKIDKIEYIFFVIVTMAYYIHDGHDLSIQFQRINSMCYFFFSAKILIVHNKKEKKNSTEFSQYAQTQARGKFHFFCERWLWWWWSIREMKKKRCRTFYLFLLFLRTNRSTNRPIDWPTNIRKKNKIIIIWYDSSKIYGHFKNNFWKLLEKKERKHSKRITRKNWC